MRGLCSGRHLQCNVPVTISSLLSVEVTFDFSERGALMFVAEFPCRIDLISFDSSQTYDAC